MEIETKILEEIGLTKSEIKVYLALLKLGSSTKKGIVKESKITPSKLYEITDKLIDKGLVSYVKKNKVLNFSAAPPELILDLLKRKKEEINKQEENFAKIIPSLKSLEKKEEPDIEVFRGWKGLRTAYTMMLNTLKEGDTDYVIGATSGEDIQAATRFFENIHRQRREKKLKLKIIHDVASKKWALGILRYPKYEQARFVKHSSPSEVNIWGDNVMIIMLTKEPMLTLIKSKVVADSFRNYFQTLWKVAVK